MKISLSVLKKPITNLPQLFKKKAQTLENTSFWGSSQRGPEVDTKSVSAQLKTQYKDWLYTCINAIADEVAGLKFVIKRTDSQNKTESLEEHPLLDLLRNPNEYMSMHEMMLYTALQLNLTGNAYWVILGGSAFSGPTELRPLSVQNIAQIETDDPLVTNYRYTYKNTRIVYTPDQIIHFKKINPDNLNTGKSMVEALGDVLSSETKASLFHLYSIDNRAIPGGILTTDQDLSVEELEVLRQQWNRAFAGSANTQKTAFLNNNTKYQAVSQSPKDLEMLETRDRNQKTIMAVARTSGAILGIQDSSNRATAEANDYTFSKRVIKPQMKLIVEAISHKLLHRYAEGRSSGVIKLDFEDPTMPDKAFNLQSLTQSVNRWRTIDEARAVQGLGPTPGGDKILVQTGLVPLDRLEEMMETRTEEIDIEDDDDEGDSDASEAESAGGGDASPPTE